MTAVRRTQLVRLGVWICFATMAVLAVVLSARTESGVRRIATLLSPPEAARTSKAPSMMARQPEPDAEQRRLAEAVRGLSADRDRLAARLATLERSLDEVTGSIPPQAARPGSQTAPVASSSLPPLPSAPPIAQPAPAPSTSSSRIAAGHLATGAQSAADSVTTKTEFGVDVGGNTSIEGLRMLWSTLKSSQPAMLDGLRPLIAVREGQKPGTLELRLVAGPLPNASIAARLCASLTAAGQSCQPTIFDGQRLALQ
jgi:hypothetical protein